jgi:CubicO group peptidase (beta-lactamase class C family)
MTQLHDAMAARVARGEYPGLVILVAREDEVKVAEMGSLTRDNLFRITSMTKPVLAAATMMLVEDGVIALDEPVERLLPELAGQRVLASVDGPLEETVPANRPVSIEDLLTFRMGTGLLTEPSFMPPFPIVEAGEQLRLTLGPPDPRTPHPPDEWIRLFGTLPLMYQPGERWQRWCWASWPPAPQACLCRICCVPASSSRSAWWTPVSTPHRTTSAGYRITS